MLPVATKSPTVAIPALKTLALSVPPVAMPNWRSPVIFRLVPVALVNVVLAKVEVPVTVRAPVMVKSAVEVPPANWMALVVVLPAFVTVWRLGVVPVGQLVPLARQTIDPFTNRLVVETVPDPSQEVVALVANKLVEEARVAKLLVVVTLLPRAFVKLRVAIVPEVELKVVIVPLSDTKLSSTLNSAYRLVLVVFVPVAFVQVIFVTERGPVSTRFAIVAVVALIVEAPSEFVTIASVFKFEMVELVASRFAIVPVVAVRVAAVMSVALSVETPRFVITPNVANKLVVVTLVAVTDPSSAFQRCVLSPKENARSVVGMRFDDTVPETVRVEVTVRVFAVVPPSSKVAPVAVRLEVVRPPKSDKACEVVAPRAVTEASVSASAVTEHPTPFERQMPTPFTVAVAKLARSL